MALVRDYIVKVFFGGGGNQTQKNYKDFTINPSESDTIVGFDAGKHPLLQNVSNMVNKNLSNPVGGTASGGSNNINIDYDKMADAFYRGTMKGNKEYGVPNATDEKIWRGQDKASAAWGPK